MLKRIKIVFALIVLMQCIVAGQNNETDSTSLDKNEDKVKLIKFFMNLDARRSYFLGQWVKMNGIRLGLEYYEKYRFGLGSYSSAKVRLKNFQNSPPNSNVQVSFDYNTFFFEYVFIKNYRWEVSAPVLWGSGNATFNVKNSLLEIDTTISSPKIPVISANGVIEYKLVPFLGLGFGLGYRLLLPDKNKVEDAAQIRQTFSAPFYYLHLKLHFGELFKCLFKNDIYEAERKAYRDARKKKKLKNESK